MFISANKNIKQFLLIFKNEKIEFVKECCLLGLEISTDIQPETLNRQFKHSIENVTKFDLTFLRYLVTLY